MVYKVADIGVDMVADMVVDMVADMGVDKVADMVANNFTILTKHYNIFVVVNFQFHSSSDLVVKTTFFKI